jgi:uncharacterized membrane protein
LIAKLCWTLLLAAVPVYGQTAAKPSGQKPAIKTPTAPAAPQSKHFPILLIASGTNPVWSVRIGMKGAERLERAGYPPIVLEPGEIASDDSGKAWTYKARDIDTNADVTLQLARESCTDGTPDGRYTFSAVVTHAQIGQLKGCAKIAPEQFPEFKQKNLDDDDPDKKKVAAPAITGFKAPVAVAFFDPAGQVMLALGAAARVVAPNGSQLSLSHDGKRLLFTRGQGNDRAILLYDAVGAKTTELQRGQVQSAFWSTDDSQIAFLKMAGQDWTVWTMPAGAPDRATQLSTSAVWALHGWQDTHTVLASSVSTLYFLKMESPPSAIPIRDVFGDGFEVASSDSIRANPNNPDLLLVAADTSHAKTGTATDAKTGSASAVFLYELTSKRRVVVTPPNVFAQDAEWSRDGIQIFFTGRDATKASSIWRIFWDGSGLKRQRAGSFMVVGQ